MNTKYLEYLGAVAFVAASIIIIQTQPAAGDIYPTLQLVAAMALASVSSPCIGFALRRLATGEEVEDLSRTYVLLTAISLLISSASLGLVLIAEMPEWRLLSPIGTAIVGIMPFLALFIEVEYP